MNLIKQEFFRWDFIYYDYSKKELDDIKAYYTGGSKDGRPIEFVSLKKAALSLSAKWEKFNKSIKNKVRLIKNMPLVKKYWCKIKIDLEQVPSISY